MLILSRRIDETICIGDSVTVTVLDVKGKQVRIGIEAPKQIPVNRLEVLERDKAKSTEQAQEQRESEVA